ncbi:MAG: hypothetical protein QOG43_1929 [Actinomycetota bacterium]|nr:hypothetical protein [Actinomycetota bacterium]
MTAEITVEEVTAVSADVVEAMTRLLPQLSRSASVPTDDELAEIVSSPATVLLAARSSERDEGAGDQILGLLTLVLFRIPTGMRAWIEDVVVDESQRGKGVGQALTREAIRRALAAGSRTVDLTSRPSREAANRLYRRLGFVERETNVYRYESGSIAGGAP